jgi:hypothetical protein
MVIKRIGPVSCARITGTLYAIIGLLAGVVFSLIAVAGGFASKNTSGRGMGAIFGVGAIVAFPILYGGIGFIFTLVVAWLYNALARFVGGIQVDLE